MLISTGLFGGITELAHPIPRSFPYFWTISFLIQMTYLSYNAYLRQFTKISSQNTISDILNTRADMKYRA